MAAVEVCMAMVVAVDAVVVAVVVNIIWNPSTPINNPRSMVPCSWIVRGDQIA